jgi:MFS family permease
VQEWVGIEFKQLAKKWWFYLSLVCVFFTGFVLQGVTGISAAHMGDVGITQAFVATVLSVHSISLACFKFLTGFMYDKFGLRVTMSVCSFTAILVMLLLAFVSNSTIGMIFAMAYGILSSLALPLETIMLPIYASDLFGQKSYGKVLGIVVATNVAGYALGTPIVNLVYSLTSSYNIALFGGAILMALVIIGMNVVIKQAQKQRMIIESEQFKAEENYGNN